ncbi:MAG: hypothetical protein QM703_27430 [Gemmatales bacterium]
MSKLFAAMFFILLCASSSYAQVLQVPGKNEKIEFIGLKRQQAQDVLDRLQALAPGKPLHACAAELKGKLGFADAAVILHFDENKKFYTVVTLIEKEDAHRVQYLPELKSSNDAASLSWKDGLALTAQQHLLQAAVYSYGLVLNGKTDEAEKMAQDTFGVKTAEVKPIWEFLKKHQSKEDQALAIWTLQHHGDYHHRALAALVLMNFADADLSWWCLVEALRDPHAVVNGTAHQVLTTLVKHRPRHVDWRPAVSSIRPILAGTNLFVFSGMLEILRNTSIAPDLSEAVLKGNTDLLTAYLQARHPDSRNKAVLFVKHLSGGGERTPEEWIDWLKKYQEGH